MGYCRVLCLAAALLLGISARAAAQSVFLEDLTWTELRDDISTGTTTVIIPVGGTRQNGPLIALGKHNVRVKILAGMIAQQLGNAIVAPVIAYVPEGNIDPATEHMRFPGTISVSHEVFEQVVQQAGAGLCKHGFKVIVFVGDHGGYQSDLAKAAHVLNHHQKQIGCRAIALSDYYQASQGPYAAALAAKGDGQDEIGTHAGLADTSLMLATDASLVRKDYLSSAGQFGAKEGIYGGSPARASAELGQLGVDLIVNASVTAIRLAIEAK